MEALFLIEFMVDNVHFSTSSLNLDEKQLKNLGKTIVQFKFLNYPPLDITEEDFCPKASDANPTDVTFKSGKSVLFSLRGCGNQPPFCVDVCVTRCRASSEMYIGRTSVNLGGSFAAILTFQKTTTPASKTTRDTYPLVNEDGTSVGSITLFIRLSCFGKMIITQFQVGGDENRSFLFKGASDQGMACESEKPLRDVRLDESKCGSPCPGQCPSHSGNPCGGSNMGPSAMMPSNMSRGNPCSSCGGTGQMMNPCDMYGGGMGMGMGNMSMGQYGDPCGDPCGGYGGYGMDPYGGGYGGNYDPLEDPCDDSKYKHFSAEVNGYSLNIKILKRKKKPKICQRIPVTCEEPDDEC